MPDASLALRPARAAPRPRGLGWVALVALLVLAPFVLAPSGVLLNNLVLAAAYVVMALGLNVVVGFAGLLDLGYVAFYAIGAYTAAYLASGYRDIHLDFLAVLVVAAAATTLAGVLIGLPTLRLRGDYIAIVTLAFGEIIGQIAANGDQITIFGGTLTAGPIGVGPIDAVDLPLLAPFDPADIRPWYWFALALVGLAILTSVRVRGSRVGRAWVALRDDERAAACMGIPIARAKLLAYATGAAFGGVAGAFLASYLRVVNAEQFEFSFSIFVLSMIVIGGLGSTRGAVVGAIVLSMVNSYVIPHVLVGPDLTALGFGLYGAIIVVVMVLRPAGLVASAPARWGARGPR